MGGNLHTSHFHPRIPVSGIFVAYTSHGKCRLVVIVLVEIVLHSVISIGFARHRRALSIHRNALPARARVQVKKTMQKRYRHSY